MCPPSDLAQAKCNTSSSQLSIETIVPQTEVSRSAYKHASDLLHPSILSHSVRVFLYARKLAEHTSSTYFSESPKLDLLFTACLFHDIGTARLYDGPQRFEVEGGDAAVNHLSNYDFSEADKHNVWTAIAIHTSPGIAERIGELSRLVRIAVLTDFGRKTPSWDTLVPLKEQLEKDFTRSNIEKVLGDAVVGQAKQRPEKAPKVSWPGVMYHAWLAEPEWNGINKAF
ncbi:hypothetical protein ACN47E_009358 [Coniothyrium glycines]